MIEFVHRLKKLSAFLAFICLVSGLLGCAASGWIWGQLAARSDVAHGQYKILSLGLPPPWRQEYIRLLRERYGIEERVVAGCIVSTSLLAYAKGYNSVSADAANRKFGHDIFKETEADAIKSLKSRPAATAP